jgi:MFS family permease
VSVRLRPASVDGSVARIGWFYALYYAALAVWLPNLPLILDDSGVSNTRIGLLLAVVPLTAIVVPPVVGSLADNRRHPNRILAAGLLLAAAAALVIGWTTSIVVIAGATFAYAVAFGPIVPLVSVCRCRHQRTQPRPRWGATRIQAES